MKDEIKAVVEAINASTGNTREILAQDNYIVKNKESIDPQAEEDKLSELLRAGVKVNESAKAQIDSIIDQLVVLRAVQKNIEEDQAQALGSSGPSSRDRPGGLLSGSGRATSIRGAGARERELQRERERERDRDRDRDREREEKRDREREREREKETKEKEKKKEKEKDPSSLYDFDGGGDSPVPSPVGNHTRKLGSVAGSAGTRDSVPPRSAGGDLDHPSEKGDSVPPDASMSNAAASARSKILYNQAQEVAFKPKPPNPGEQTDWYLGRVVQVTGEGKSRRYKVQDADPDVPAAERAEYRTSANSMIGVPEAGANLPPRAKGEIVLALYPDSTTFYKAEVISTDATTGKVNLRFEGEENSGTLQVVERRVVLDYPKDKK